MFKDLMNTAIVTASVIALGSTGAFAGNDGKSKIKDYVYDVQSAWTTMHVTSSDGTEWDDLKSGHLQFWAQMKIDTKWPGAVEHVGVVLGNCSGESCKSFPLLWSDSVGERDYNHQRNFSVGASLLENGTAGLALARQNIIDTCNQHLTPRGPTTKHEFQSSLTTTFVADTDKRDLAPLDLAQAQGDQFFYPEEIDHAKSGEFTFNVVCDPYIPGTTADGLKMEEGDFKTTGIDLFLSTFSGATTQPNPATTCKKGRILVRVNTSKAGPAKFKLWTRVGNGPITSEVFDAWASFDGNSKYVAEHTKWISVDEPTQVQAMAEDMVNSVGPSTQWKDIMLQCTGPGGKGGGLTVDHDEPVLPDLKVTGDFSYVDVGSPKCSRTGKALISFTSNRSDNIHYSLDCTNGQHLSGYVKPVQVPGKGYVAAAMQSFQIDKTTVYSCALKTVQPGPVELHEWKGHTFKCVHRAVETGSDDVQVAPKPTDDASGTPADVKVAPKPKDVDAVKRREEALKRAREAAQKKAEAVNKAEKAAEEAKRKRAEAAKKAAEAKRRKALLAAQQKAEEAKRKRAEAAKKAAEEAQRKRAEAARKAAEEARQKRAEAAKKAAEAKRHKALVAAQKAAEEAKRKRAAAKKRHKPRTNAVVQSVGRR